MVGGVREIAVGWAASFAIVVLAAVGSLTCTRPIVVWVSLSTIRSPVASLISEVRSTPVLLRTAACRLAKRWYWAGFVARSAFSANVKICAGLRTAATIGAVPAKLGAVLPLAIGRSDSDSDRPVVSSRYWNVRPCEFSFIDAAYPRSAATHGTLWALAALGIDSKIGRAHV